MKRSSSTWLLALTLLFTLSSCDLVGGVFKAGFYTAIIIVVLVVALVLWLVRRKR